MSARAAGQAAQRYGRYAVWAIPIFALLAGLTQRSAAAFSADPATYARYVASGRYQPVEILTAVGTSLSGLLSIVALGALLSRGRGRRFATAGAIIALTGSVALLVIVGSVIVRADRVRAPLLRGRLDAMAVTAGAKGTLASIIVLSGAALLAAGWILLGVAVIRASRANRADGALLIISAPLLYIGGMFQRAVPTVGSFLLLAAGLGIAFAAGHAVPADGAVDRVPRRARGVSTAWSVTRTGSGRDGMDSTGDRTSKARRRSGNGMPDSSTGPAAGRE